MTFASLGQDGVYRPPPTHPYPATLPSHYPHAHTSRTKNAYLWKLREAAKKEEKRQKKRQGEARQHRDRLHSKQKSLLLDFGRSGGSKGRGQGASTGGAGDAGGSERGGGMLESMASEVLWQVRVEPW